MRRGQLFAQRLLLKAQRLELPGVLPAQALDDGVALGVHAFAETQLLQAGVELIGVVLQAAQALRQALDTDGPGVGVGGRHRLQRRHGRGRQRLLTVHDDPSKWFGFGEERDTPLHDLDVILMRKDPPFDIEYITTTWLLDSAARAGTLVVNTPSSLRDANEKLFITRFPHCCVAMLVSSDPAVGGLTTSTATSTSPVM